MKKRFLAGITTYQPDIDRLKENLDAISCQVDKVIIVDNCSDNITDIEQAGMAYDNIVLIKNNKNEGIAYAMNVVGKYAYDNDYEWFLTLDQDSVCPLDLIKTYQKYISGKIGILAPFIAETMPFIGQLFKKGDGHKVKSDKEISKIFFAVSSGQLINTKAWHEADGFWDYLFIDYVDQEFCFHLTKLGYEIIRVNSCELSHIQGEPIRILGIETSQQSALREYYCARNSRLVYWLYKKEYTRACPHVPFITTLKRIANVLLVRDDVFKKLNAIFKGVKDAYRWKKKYGVSDRSPRKVEILQ